jgi:sugar transferase (PEP-CTERM/EpsH1 system associated)
MAPNSVGEIRVLHVIETLDVGGAEAVVANIVNHSSPGIRSTICCLVRSGPIAARVRPGIDILELGKSEHGNDYGIPLRLARLLRDRRIDVVHSHDWGTLLESVAAATLAGASAIHMAHGPSIHYRAGDRWAGLKMATRRRMERLASLKLHRLVAVSQAVRAELMEEIGIPASKIELIHNGIDLVAGAREDPAVRRRQLGCGAGDVLVVSVGRLAAIKNYGFLLEAFGRAVSLVNSLRLALVGDGPERPALEAMATALGLGDRVRFLGARDDVHQWLAAANVFVLPSLYEGISISLLEAMAARLPSVVTRVGGNPEVVTDGEDGLLVESGDVAAMAGALSALAQDPARCQWLGRAARARVEAEFDVATAVRRYEAIYRSSIGLAGV